MDKQQSKKKICITGGHLSPAVAVIEEIQKQKKYWDIVFVGRAKTSRASRTMSEEKLCIEQMHIPFFTIHAGRVARFFSLQTFLDAVLIPVGFLESVFFCLRERPNCIVSFGGYVGLPMILAGWLFGIPTVIHEQTHVFGLSNAIAAEFANSILLTFPDVARRNDTRVHVTGLPLRFSFFHPAKEPSMPISTKKPIIYMTGGTTGAVSMNELLFPIIQSLVKNYMVVHQTGQQSYAKALTVQASLDEDVRAFYLPTPYIDSTDVSWIMHNAALVVGRSGANTVAEISALQLPAVFIPLPWAGRQEQRRNATWYAATGGHAKIVDQQKITPLELLRDIEDILRAGKKGVSQNRELPDAAASIVQSIDALV